ncbi:MAG TPA: hypothetical protein VK897_18545, partial [Anaerolineales bacterium]|nr:hypothetical protein [Anaerolineales bacterium]
LGIEHGIYSCGMIGHPVFHHRAYLKSKPANSPTLSALWLDFSCKMSVNLQTRKKARGYRLSIENLLFTSLYLFVRQVIKNN